MTTNIDHIALCTACNTPLQGPFCHHCGLRHQAGQLNMRQMGVDLRTRLIDWEQGFFRTLWHLLRQPKTMLDQVLSGRRKGYNHPVTFLLICATLALLAIQLYDDAFWQFFRDTMLRDMQASRLGQEAINRFVDVHAATMAILPYWMLFFSLPTALFMRWFFPKRGHTVAEYWLLNLYAVAVALLLDAVVGTVATLTGIDPQFQIRQMSAGILMLICLAYIGRAWLGGGLWTIARILLAMFLAGVINGVLQQAAAYSYAYWGGILGH